MRPDRFSSQWLALGGLLAVFAACQTSALRTPPARTLEPRPASGAAPLLIAYQANETGAVEPCG